jgi:predicted dehydrogenase
MKAMSSHLKVVIRGTGSIGMRHIRVFRDLLGMRTIAVPKRLDRALSLQQEGYATARSLSEAISGEDSIVVVATDTGHHVKDAESAISLGCNVLLIEKPLSSNHAEAMELKRTTSRANVKAFVACNLRFDSGLNAFRERLNDIGEIHHVRIEAQSYLPEWRPNRDYRESYSANLEEGGVLRDLIHEIDYAVWLYGKPTDVTARLNNSGRLGIAAEESADLLWCTPNGGIVSIRLDYVTRHYRRKMTAFGSKGDLTWDFSSQTIQLQALDNTPITSVMPQSRDEMMGMQAAAFVNAATNKNTGQLATLEEGIFAIAVCDAARISSSTGRTESIRE